jgi:membrane protein YdbS with pleckstrin-like domain
MSYVDSILEPDEKVIYRTTLSWTLYAPAIGLALAAAIVAVLESNYAHMEVIGLTIAAILALMAAVSFARAWFRRASTEIAVTDRRVILKRGFIRRHTVEMNMHKVESVDVDQTLPGRILNYGNVTVRGTGSTFETIRGIDSPLRLRTAVTTR